MVFAFLGLAIFLGLTLSRMVTAQVWRSSGGTGRVYLTIGWSLVALGTIHVLATPLFNDGFMGAALWFASGGIAMALAGALNVLSSLYAAAAPGIRVACIAANTAWLLLAAAFLWRARAMLLHAPQYVLLFSLLLFATIYSVRGGRSAIVRA